MGREWFAEAGNPGRLNGHLKTIHRRPAMFARSRARLFALVCAAALSIGCESALGAFVVDTSRLPRITGSREIHASPKSTSFITRESVTRAFELTAGELINDDWQPFEDPTAARTSDPNGRSMSFKKEGRALQLLITISPSQANATSVSYTEIALRHDLPFPKEATAIRFDPEAPYLGFVTARGAEATLDYFRSELRPLGWSLWSAREGARQAASGIAGELTVNGAHAYYVRENSAPLMLTLSRRDDFGFNVEIKAIAPERLAALRDKTTGTGIAAGASVPAALIPVPHASEGVDFDGATGALKFTNRASVGIVAEYYRSTLRALGWQETPTAIDNDQTAVLRFTNGAKELSIAITHVGAKTKVQVEGSGLRVAAAVSRSM
jgi:hypothetical protein